MEKEAYTHKNVEIEEAFFDLCSMINELELFSSEVGAAEYPEDQAENAKSGGQPPRLVNTLNYLPSRLREQAKRIEGIILSLREGLIASSK